MKTFLERLLVAAMLVASASGRNTVTETPVTAVEGVSWLTHLHRAFDETSMGKTGRLGPPVFTPPQDDLISSALRRSDASRASTLRGEDLYRLNCRACHGESGLGAPPEINAVINPVRASSTVAIMARMKAAGMDITRSDAAKLAQQSSALLLQRLHNGGQDMPAFPYLGDPEVSSLIAYLRQLASVPGAENEQIPVAESPEHVGELIVKSTCHICHSASGDNPTPQQLSDGAIPPLSALAMRTNRPQFIRKVIQGAPVVMGKPPLLCRGRMPVFYYLSEIEAADAYRYLMLDSSGDLDSSGRNDDPAALALVTDRPDSEGANTRSIRSATLASGPEPVSTALPQDAQMENAAFLPVAGLLAILLLASCFAFTVREMKRLASPASAVPSGDPLQSQNVATPGANGGQPLPDLAA